MEKKKRVMVMFDDYTGLPRAWAVSTDRAAAEFEARRQLVMYCKKNVGIEPELADPAKFKMRVETVKE